MPWLCGKVMGIKGMRNFHSDPSSLTVASGVNKKARRCSLCMAIQAMFLYFFPWWQGRVEASQNPEGREIPCSSKEQLIIVQWQLFSKGGSLGKEAWWTPRDRLERRGCLFMTREIQEIKHCIDNYCSAIVRTHISTRTSGSGLGMNSALMLCKKN